MIAGRFALNRRNLLASAAGAVAIGFTQPSGALAKPADAIGLGRGQSFDLGWRFRRGEGTGQEAAGFDDGGWRSVDLPHDWGIEDLPPVPGDQDRVRGPFDRDADGNTYTGFTVGGEGWYRKRFRLSTPRPGRVEILFEGVYMDSDVWINGHRLGNHRNGYTPFAYDLTPYLAADGDNLIAVRVRNRGNNARWYAGSGIYRHVWLDVLAEPARFDRWGTQVVTRRIAGGTAQLEIETSLLGAGEGLSVVAVVRDANGRKQWEGVAPAGPVVRLELSVPGAALWSPEHPNLYSASIELRRGPVTLDRIDTPFGIRVIAYDATAGMTINGIPTKLRGGCIHHDHGPLGVAAFDQAEERKVALLRARGFNAVRPSHNPFSPAFLRACDAQGMMVVCETFDLWHKPKFEGDYAGFFDRDWETDLDAIVRSSRNHPSIVMWSIGNEIPGRLDPKGVETQWQLTNSVHRLDPTRAVTAAIHGFPGHVVTVPDKAARVGAGSKTDRAGTVFLDVIGYNYKLADYDVDHSRFPDRIFYGSESFPKDMFEIWEKTEKSPWLIGDFVWTAMDYLGEAGIGGTALVPAAAREGAAQSGKWPWINAFCGDLDLTGHQKAQSLARDVVWGVSMLEIAVQRPAPAGMREDLRFWGWPDEVQSWTWPVQSAPMTVRAYTVGDRVELRLNGRKIADRTVTAADRKRVEFAVPFVPGTLEAIAYRGGTELARRKLETVGKPSAIRLRPERLIGSAMRGAVTYVDVEVVDEKGRPIPDLEQDITLSVLGVGELVAFASANPLATGSYQLGSAKSWCGRALAIIRSTGKPGKVLIRAQGSGLKAGLFSLNLK